jgi:ribosomal protein L11 methylase PrmA
MNVEMGTEIVILSTDTYDGLKKKIAALEQKLENYGKAIEFKPAEWREDKRPELTIHANVLAEPVKEAWDNYKGENKDKFALDPETDWYGLSGNIVSEKPEEEETNA